MDGMQLSRRGLFGAGGALVVGFALAPKPAAAWTEKPVALDQVDSYLTVGADGKVTIYVGKVDLGTGLRTGFLQIAADELDVPMAGISVVEGDTALTPDQGPTYGSLGIQVGGVQLRQAAATARQALVAEAASRFGLPATGLRTVDAAVVAPDGRRLAYAALVGGKAFSLPVDANAPIKPPEARRVVGRPVARVDIPDKVFGRFRYVHDLKLPGMLHGRAVRPPALGAVAEAGDAASVAQIPGIVKVVHEKGFVGVVAESEWAAIKAQAALKVRWSAWAGLPDQAKLWEHVRATPVAQRQVTSEKGDPAAGIAGAAKKLSASYDFAIHTHGSMGPSCAVAEFKDGRLTVWTASQATHNLRKQLAMMLGEKVEQVRCIYREGAGCSGRTGHEAAAADAALLAKAPGKPVRVQWMRAEEHGWDPKGPPTLIDLR